MSEHLKAADRYLTDAMLMLFRGRKETWHTNIENSVGMIIRHLEEQQNHQHQVTDYIFAKTSGPLSPATTPSVSTSPSQSGEWLSASAIASLGEWLRQCPQQMITAGFRLIVQHGSGTLSSLDGAGTLTIPTGILGQPSTSGSEPEEAGARGQAPVAAEPATSPFSELLTEGLAIAENALSRPASEEVKE